MPGILRRLSTEFIVQVLILLAVLGFAVSNTWLVATSRDDTSTARTQAVQATAALRTLKHIVASNCEQRVGYDRSTQAARRSQVHLYQVLARTERDPRRMAAYRSTITSLRRPLRIGTPDGCARYRSVGN